MEFPNMPSSTVRAGGAQPLREFDMREWLDPRRLTVVMWDQAFLTRHTPGDSFADYDRVLDEVVERGYNCLRIDPLPQCIDLARPETVIRQPPFDTMPYLPWTQPKGFEGPAGQWLIEFVEKARARGLHYCLSSWWGDTFAPVLAAPHTLQEGADAWLRLLRQWKARLGFDGCVFVDLNNEFPCFLPGLIQHLKAQGGETWSSSWTAAVEKEINGALARMREEFPELRFCVSLHGDVRYTNLTLELDCMDMHFYADADPRWAQRTGFQKLGMKLFQETGWHAEYSDRCRKSHKAAAAMYRARQRAKVGAFAGMAENRGIPLLTTESWAAWYCIDSPEMDWGWLLDWAAWSVEDAIDYRMWGWTPHNYAQPQFANWKDVAWHQRLTRRFLES